jgi:protein kinase A
LQLIAYRPFSLFSFFPFCFFQTRSQSEKNTQREHLMPTFGALLKKKKNHSTGSKDSPSSPTVAEASSTLPTEKPADAEPNRTTGRESSDKARSAVNPNTNNTNNHNSSNSNKGASPDTQMNSAASTNQQSAQGANNSSHHNSHHHHLPNIGSIKSIINPTHNQHVTTEGHTGANYSQNSQEQLQKSQARQTKGKYSLEDFSLQRTLGTGSFGRVHLVQSRHNHRFYAIKVLKKAQVVKMKQVEHTNDERRMLQRVKHPFLITLWGTFQDSKNLYMVMDFVEGGELFSLLRKSQVWSVHSVLLLCIGLTDRAAIPQSGCQILRCRSDVGIGISAFAAHNISRPQARKPAAGSARAFENYRFWLCKRSP